ncbi:ABC transporter substrate-binding protein [Promicromonospora citrea]|uniref:Sugar ABC transporter substrate-binding protein n=1 Tax=Promicromonospora citrea TaxID=43677 RepID=A0A8H9L1Q9_9MICO|nr:sugar ABC transporter substrate-binding protein [Promicromonospora citrea]NNH51918.1 sugar ABC transporter substrate-binding protein [Promicromonospora citrea]GGM08243.1 sugar ABC transporter substrate-binding protein [Promicromonospora citrea]
MNRKIMSGVGLAAVASLALTGCGGQDEPAAVDGPVTLTLAGWDFASTPEFQTLADAYHEANPDVTVELKEYPAGDDYDTALTADLAAGAAPDVFIVKNLKNYVTFTEGGTLLDISDVAAELDPATGGLAPMEVDGATYAVPYRQDSWLLYYNKELFEKAGVDLPDGSWTWDDYAEAAAELTEGIGEKQVTGTYLHSWQSTVQGFALAQSGAPLDGGDFSFLAPYYERALAMQDEGSQPSYATVTTNELAYQAQFGTQKAAMLPMGSWYIGTLVAEQESGAADTFEWGIAPIPQADESTTGTDATPVTFGDPTTMGINSGIDESKIETAKDFLAFAAGPEGAAALAGIGITPALIDDAVADTVFGLDGVPQDDLSRFAYTTHETLPENPVGPTTAAIQTILGEAHSAIMSESTPVDEALAEAEERVVNEVG